MVNDSVITSINHYDDFSVRNMVAYRGPFEHPWFFDTYQHRLMEDFSEEFVHLRALRTGVIFQFRLDRIPRAGCEGLLITSTNEDTCYVLPHREPSIQRTVERMQLAEKPSRTAYNGIVKAGEYIRAQAEHLKATLDACGSDLTSENLKLILTNLYLRRSLYAGE